MRKSKPLAESQLLQTVAGVLCPEGFQIQRNGQFFEQAYGPLRFVVGFRASQCGGGDRAIFFTVWIPELDPEPGNRKSASDAKFTRVFPSFGVYELSPVAPLKNTYWWPLNGLSPELKMQLTSQLHTIVLPYFRTFKSLGDMAELLRHGVDAVCQNVLRRIESEPSYRGDLRAPVFVMGEVAEKIRSTLAFLESETLGFSFAGDRYWRRRNGVIDVIAIEYLASMRFVSACVAVWHDAFEEAPITDPEDVPMMAWHRICTEGIDVEDGEFLWFMGAGDQERTRLGDAVRAHGLEYLKHVIDRTDVIDAIRPEYRRSSYFPKLDPSPTPQT